MSLPSDVAGLAQFAGLPGLSSVSDLYAAILKSGRIRGKIIENFDLMKEFKTKTMVDTYKALDEITKVTISPEGIIAVSITYKNKYLAADIANSFINELDRFNTETAMTTGKKYRIFIEERLADTEDSLAQAEEALKDFQEKHRTVALDVEIETAITTLAELKSEIILLEVQRGAAASGANINNPYVKKIEGELRELKKQLTKIEFGSKDTLNQEFGAGFSVPLSELPATSLEYVRLFREVKIQEAIYELLTQQYEQAKIMELKDTPTVQILDVANPPEKKSWPKRTMIVLLAMFLSFFGSIILSFLLEYVDELKNKPEQHENILLFVNTFLKDTKIFRTWVNRFFGKKQ